MADTDIPLSLPCRGEGSMESRSQAEEQDDHRTNKMDCLPTWLSFLSMLMYRTPSLRLSSGNLPCSLEISFSLEDCLAGGGFSGCVATASGISRNIVRVTFFRKYHSGPGQNWGPARSASYRGHWKCDGGTGGPRGQ